MRLTRVSSLLLLAVAGTSALRPASRAPTHAPPQRPLDSIISNPGTVVDLPFVERFVIETLRAAFNSFTAWMSLRMILSRTGGDDFVRVLLNRTVQRLGGEQPVLNCSTRFDDVSGVDEVVVELQEAVAYLRDPTNFSRLGARMPRGVLLEGVPGTGKTLLARAVAGEAGVPFFSASASGFDEKYVGVGAQRVRALFDAARRAAPAIVFIDEIDCVGASRERGGERNVHAQTLNALLTEMDGFDQNSGIVVLAATNQVGSLDSALRRPGRFDRIIHVPPPDIVGRRRMLARLAGRMTLADDVGLEELARSTVGLTGAEIENVLNQAALRAATDGASCVTRAAVEAARDKVLLGVARPSAVVSPEDRWVTAVHEAGHALVARLTAGANALQKVTIVPHSIAGGGSAAGLTVSAPREGDHLTRRQLMAQLDVCMGGRVAEELLVGAHGVGVGAEMDFRQARSLALMMHSRWGLGRTLGPGGVADERSLSAHTQRLLDAEVKETLEASHARARALLRRQARQLRAVAEALTRRETLSKDELDEVLEASGKATPARALMRRVGLLGGWWAADEGEAGTTMPAPAPASAPASAPPPAVVDLDELDEPLLDEGEGAVLG